MQSIRTLLVITAILGTVPLVPVLAEETVKISNSVHSSTHTGGNLTTDGQPGADGRDGADGTDGTSLVTEGSRSAAVSITTVENGEIVTDHATSVRGSGSASVHTASTARATSADEVTEVATESQSTDNTVRAHLIESLQTLQAILKQYVDLLF